jgi:eukaryotic-like serine/threonine-protein kinase
MTTIPGQGALVAGVYRLDAIRERGQHHMIVAAHHAELGTRVVLEMVWPSRIDSLTVQRFLRETRAASELRSPHVARVLDAGVLDDGGFYTANEVVDGEPVRAILAQRGSLPVHEVAVFGTQMCDAVSEAHANEIVHRDLEIGNVIVARGGVKLQGIARLTALLRAPNADARTDIFALGRILFEMVTGHSPLVAGVATLRQRANLPPGFVAILERCLEPDANRRFQRVWDFASALAVFTTQQQVLREAPAFTAASVVAVEADLGR